jgi:hypothetical protein
VHSISNSEVVLDGDRAKGRTLVSNPMCLRDGKGKEQVFTVYAYYHDELVRSEAGWRIASRVEEHLLTGGDVPEALKPKS